MEIYTLTDEKRRKEMDLTTLKIIKEESIPKQY